MERAPMLIDDIYPVSEARAYLLAWLYDTFEVDPQHPHRLDNIASVLLHAFHTIEDAVPDLVMARGQPLLRVLTDHIDELAAAIYPSQVRARAILNNVPAKSAEWALTVSQLFAMHGPGEQQAARNRSFVSVRSVSNSPRYLLRRRESTLGDQFD